MNFSLSSATPRLAISKTSLQQNHIFQWDTVIYEKEKPRWNGTERNEERPTKILKPISCLVIVFSNLAHIEHGCTHTHILCVALKRYLTFGDIFSAWKPYGHQTIRQFHNVFLSVAITRERKTENTSEVTTFS